MHPFSLQDAISQAIGEMMMRSNVFQCVFIDTKTPRFIRKLKQGIVLYTKKRKERIFILKQDYYHRMIASLRIEDRWSVLS